MSTVAERVAEQFGEALAAADAERFADLLHSQVAWGAPGGGVARRVFCAA